MALKEKERSAANQIVAPRIFNYQRPGAGWGKASLTRPRSGRMERVGGIRYTIKDGIVYDAKKLLADVAAMVRSRRSSGHKRPAVRTPG